MFKAVGYHTIAKVLVVLAAYILHFMLGKVLTLAEYGIIGTIITFCNFYYMFLTNGARQAISKSIACGSYKTSEVLKKGLVFQLIFSLLLAAVSYFFAPFFAHLFGSEAFTAYFRHLSLLIVATGMYFTLTGGLNGLKLFFLEAVVTAVYPLLRLLAVPMTGLYKNDKPTGIILGFTLASIVSALLTAFFIAFGSKKRTTEPANPKSLSYREIVGYSVEFICFFSAITLVLNLDTFFLQYVCKDEELTGLYTGVHTFSLVPYYLVSAFYLVILPYISEKWAKNDKRGVSEIVRNNCGILFALILPITVLISISAKPLLSCFYDSGYAQAGSSLSVLCFGTFLLSFYSVLSVILNGIEKKRFANILSLFVLALDVVLLFTLIPALGLLGAALATSISSLVGCLVSYIYLHRQLGPLVSGKLLAKSAALIAVFAAVCFVILRLAEFTSLLKLMLLFLVLGILYLFCIILFGVIDVRSLLSKGSTKSESTEE